MTTRQELRNKLLFVLESWEETHPAGTEELLSYMQKKGGDERTKISPQIIQNFAKGTLAGIGEWLKEQRLGGFTLHLGWREPFQKKARGTVKEALTRMYRELPEPQRTTLIRFLQEISPLVEESLREFEPEQIALAIMERSLDGNPETGSRVLGALL